MPLWLPVWLYLMAINIVAFATFGIDKQLAISRSRRISERHLLLLTLIGGTGGAYLGRWYFRHKTRKRDFSATLHLMALIQIAAIGWFVIRP